MEKQILDYTLAPAGLLLLLAYHLWLFYQIKHHPTKTCIGVNVISRHAWAEAMMEEMPKNGLVAVLTLRNNIMAATILATASITLNSTIILMISNFNSSTTTIIYGDLSELLFRIKVSAVVVCFLSVFLFNVQSVRYYTNASFLICVPVKKVAKMGEYVRVTISKGLYFWALGMRTFYFSFPLFMWLFGPIPMFCCCLLLVSTLHLVDFTSDCRSASGDFHHNDDVEQGT